VLSPLASALRLASVVVCLIVIASFALFVVNKTSSASAHQQQELNGTTTPESGRIHKSVLRGEEPTCEKCIALQAEPTQITVVLNENCPTEEVL